jgi:competence protein ComEA
MFKRLLAALFACLAMSAFAAVDANKASAADLDAVKGIGPGISARIVEERNKAPFKSWDDFIERVKGVGEGNAAKLSAAGLTVGGASFKGLAPAPVKAAAPAAKPMPAPAAAAAAMPAKATAAAAAPAAPTKAELKAKAKAEKEAAAQAKKDAKAKAAAAAASGAKK